MSLAFSLIINIRAKVKRDTFEEETFGFILKPLSTLFIMVEKKTNESTRLKLKYDVSFNFGSKYYF